jgi:hypothetical protein
VSKITIIRYNYVSYPKNQAFPDNCYIKHNYLRDLARRAMVCVSTLCSCGIGIFQSSFVFEQDVFLYLTIVLGVEKKVIDVGYFVVHLSSLFV